MNLKKLGMGAVLLATSLVSLASCNDTIVDYADGLTESTGLTIVWKDNDPTLGNGEINEESAAKYISETDYYVWQDFGTNTDNLVVIPEFYDDGVHGKHPVSATCFKLRPGEGQHRTVICHNTMEFVQGQTFRLIERWMANGVRALGYGNTGALCDEYVVLPQKCEILYQYAFLMNKHTKKFWLPKTLKRIGNAPFQDNSTCETIEFEGSEAEWNAITFDDGDWATANTLNVNVVFNVAFPGAQYATEAYTK